MNNGAITIDDFRQVDVRPEPQSPPATIEHNGRSTPQPPRRRRKLVWLAIFLTAGVATTLGAYLHHAAKFEETDNSFVEADVHPVSSRVSGNVLEVLAEDNQAVEKGQPLAKLDPRDFEVKLTGAETAFAQASAQVPQAQAALEQARAALNQAEAQIRTSEAQLERARLDFDRAESLRRGPNKVISEQERDNAKAGLDAATGTTDAARAARDAATAGVSNAEANLNAAIAGRERAQASVDDAKLQLSYTTILAPESGRIAKKTVQTGQHLQPGQPLMAVVSPDRWIVANFKENQLAEMRSGQLVEVSIDAISSHEFRGHIDSFAPGTGAKFTLLPPDNATGNFTKIVQRVPVKILLNLEDVRGFEDRIVAGLSATTTVRLKD